VSLATLIAGQQVVDALSRLAELIASNPLNMVWLIAGLVAGVYAIYRLSRQESAQRYEAAAFNALKLSEKQPEVQSFLSENPGAKAEAYFSLGDRCWVITWRGLEEDLVVMIAAPSGQVKKIERVKRLR